MKRSEIDRLGTRLRRRTTAEDLTLLDMFRREFRPAYESVVDKIRSELQRQASGRPAKSTTSIVDKLKRSSIRLSQMQDIAGCRLVVSSMGEQSAVVQRLSDMFDATIDDRRIRPSHGYRAVHLIVREGDALVEVQVRTTLQHLWAELSEKMSDEFGTAFKYGGGPVLERLLADGWSELVRDYEEQFERTGLTGQLAQEGERRKQALYESIAKTIADRENPQP